MTTTPETQTMSPKEIALELTRITGFNFHPPGNAPSQGKDAALAGQNFWCHCSIMESAQMLHPITQTLPDGQYGFLTLHKQKGVFIGADAFATHPRETLATLEAALPQPQHVSSAANGWTTDPRHKRGIPERGSGFTRTLSSD